jgi:hypothetical protein
MLRHGADAMANAIVDGCADAVRGCMRFGASTAQRVARVTRAASSATLRPVPVRALRRVSSHA